MSSYQCQRCKERMYLLQNSCDECGQKYRWSIFSRCGDCGSEVDIAEESKCHSCHKELETWRFLESIVDNEGKVRVNKDSVHSPISSGYVLHFGFPRMQILDYRRISGTGGDYHVVSYPDYYQLHQDRTSALLCPISHLLLDGFPKSLETLVSITSSFTNLVV